MGDGIIEHLISIIGVLVHGKCHKFVVMAEGYAQLEFCCKGKAHYLVMCSKLLRQL